MWLEHWDFIVRENEMEKKDTEENEVIGLSQKPQSEARGREGGGRVYNVGKRGVSCTETYLFQCSILFLFLQLKIQLIISTHACVVYMQTSEEEEKREKKRGNKQRKSRFVLYFPLGVPHLSSTSSAKPAWEPTQTVFGLVLNLKCLYLL